jgi:hypothetical protein
MTKNKSLLAVAVVVMASVVFASTLAHADVVFQDNLDGDGIETNTGIGDGLGAYERQGGPWLDDGSVSGVDSNRTGNNDRANLYSLNAFDLTGGFKLEVTHTISNVTTIDANRAVIGLLDADDLPAEQTNTTYITDFLNRDLNYYGIGLNLTIQNSTQGLNFADGTDLNQLSNDQTIATGTQSWVLEVDAAGNWSYSIDGETATTGASVFDVARDYHFFAYVQDNHNDLIIESVTLSTLGGGPPFPADLNQDGFVDGLDLGIQLINWGQDVTPDQGELNGAPPVNGLDLGLLLIAWNPKPLSAAAVPEPSSFTLVLASLCLALGRRRIAAR